MKAAHRGPDAQEGHEMKEDCTGDFSQWAQVSYGTYLVATIPTLVSFPQEAIIRRTKLR